MGAKRKRHGEKFKAQVAMATLLETRRWPISSEYGVHVTMISNRKQEFLKPADELLERGNKKTADPKKINNDLHLKIGQLHVERHFLVGFVAGDSYSF